MVNRSLLTTPQEKTHRTYIRKYLEGCLSNPHVASGFVVVSVLISMSLGSFPLTHLYLHYGQARKDLNSNCDEKLVMR